MNTQGNTLMNTQGNTLMNTQRNTQRISIRSKIRRVYNLIMLHHLLRDIQRRRENLDPKYFSMLRLGRFSCVQSLGGNNQARKSEFRVVWKVLCNLMDSQHTHTHIHTHIHTQGSVISNVKFPFTLRFL